jgi:hypothetical protein
MYVSALIGLINLVAGLLILHFTRDEKRSARRARRR